MVIEFSRNFKKQYDKAPNQIQLAYQQRLQLFLVNPQHPQLRLHALKGSWKGYLSINVTGDWRVLFVCRDDKTITFHALGTHSQLYR